MHKEPTTYTVARTKDLPNHTLKETNLRNLESMDQEHRLGADDVAAYLRERKHKIKGVDISL